MKTKILADFQIYINVPLNTLCTCGAEVETTEHFQLYSTHRSELFDKIVKVEQQFLNLAAKDQVLLLLND